MPPAATSDPALSTRPAGGALPRARDAATTSDSGSATAESLNLDHVLDGVESLSNGIDAMLRAAATSSIGAIPPTAAPGLTSSPVAASETPDRNLAMAQPYDDEDVSDEEPMMQFFDEETPSDIHAIDRMLARHAEELADQQPLDEGPESDGVPTISIIGQPGRSREDVLAVIGEPGQVAPERLAATFEPPHESPTVSDTPSTTVRSEHDAPTGLARAHTDRTATIEIAATVAPATDTQTPATSHNRLEPTAAATRRSRSLVGAIRSTVVQALTLINLPLDLMPTSLRPMANATAITLAMWAPAIWLLAPVLAERVAKMRDASIAEPTHHESGMSDEHASDAPPEASGQH